VSRKSTISKWCAKAKSESGEYRLHPLIHTRPDFTAAQDVEKKKAELKTPHFLSLNQDIVAWSQKAKCALKYDISNLGKAPQRILR
jgi:hypothetical protein